MKERFERKIRTKNMKEQFERTIETKNKNENQKWKK
jgi:hypothetical protein